MDQSKSIKVGLSPTKKSQALRAFKLFSCYCVYKQICACSPAGDSLFSSAKSAVSACGFHSGTLRFPELSADSVQKWVSEMFEKCKLICLGNAEGKQDWLEKGGDAALIFSADQLKGMLLIGEDLPEEIVFAGSLKEFIHLFPERMPEESCELVNSYLEKGVAQWVEKEWEFFTCRAAVLGCCSGFYLSIVNKKDLR